MGADRLMGIAETAMMRNERIRIDREEQGEHVGVDAGLEDVVHAGSIIETIARG